MQQNVGLLTQHVPGTSMPIIMGTIVSSAFWCPNLESRLGCVALGCEMCVLLRGCGHSTGLLDVCTAQRKWLQRWAVRCVYCSEDVVTALGC
jgi:hypothetical protein